MPDAINNKIDVEITDNGLEEASYPDAKIELDETGLVGHWKMDGNFTDSSENVNNGVINGGVTATADGQRRQAGNFDGVNDYVQMNNSNDFDFTDTTYSVWVKPSDTSG